MPEDEGMKIAGSWGKKQYMFEVIFKSWDSLGIKLHGQDNFIDKLDIYLVNFQLYFWLKYECQILKMWTLIFKFQTVALYCYKFIHRCKRKMGTINFKLGLHIHPTALPFFRCNFLQELILY